MSAGITSTDGMFSVREKPWHGLGVILPDLATADEAINAANLGWEVGLTPMGYEDPDNAGIYLPAKGEFATIRSDNKHMLGHVGSRYTPFQNRDAFKIMDEVTQDPNGPKYVTAGSLFGGKKVWALLKLPNFIQTITPKDQLEDYILGFNSHDGSAAVSFLYTSVRVVCQNTLNMALSKNTRGGIFRAKHTTNIMDKVTDVQKFLGIVAQDRITTFDAIQHMRTVEPTKEQIEDVFTKLFGKVSDEDNDETTRSKNIKAEILNLYHDGEANKAAGDNDSAWAFLNGITEYNAYDRTSRSGDKLNQRVDSNWFGVNAKSNALAFDLCSALK